MPKKPKPSTPESEAQLQLDFGEVIKTARVRSRDELIAFQDYDPVERTADYMQRAVQFEAAWDSTIKKAREELMGLDPRELYLGFIKDLYQKTTQNAARSARFAHLLELVAVRGLGMSRDQIRIDKPAKGGTRWRVFINEKSIAAHLNQAK
ncbi:MAG: hypothetical protein JST85_26665 [Acidobacteria bacterium]|nr:hypothetical protein [Acidobacteriota bacterium]